MMLSKEKVQTSFEALSEKFGYTNRLSRSPHREGRRLFTVSARPTRTARQLIEGRLARITGQKAAPRAAKASIAQFKMREGDIVGYQVTLRGARMYDFIDKLIHIALPRTRDFRGLPATAIDDMGNLTIGIREHTIFPEAADEDLKDVFGIAITIVTTAKSKEEAFFRHLGVPFRHLWAGVVRSV
jgi:large subunit ribosomal protein L5